MGYCDVIKESTLKTKLLTLDYLELILINLVNVITHFYIIKNLAFFFKNSNF